jgi:hypothetical protein
LILISGVQLGVLESSGLKDMLRRKELGDRKRLIGEKIVLLARYYYVWMINSRSMRVVQYVACTGEKMKWYGLLVGTLEGKSLLRFLDIDGIIIIILLKFICKNTMGEHVRINLANIVNIENPAVGEMVGSCEDCNEHLSWNK